MAERGRHPATFPALPPPAYVLGHVQTDAGARESRRAPAVLLAHEAKKSAKIGAPVFWLKR
ncbi:hypothetical protein Asi02nite_16210 [Asanoa siamensis]|uniref:Uncharacterized protein n=1 Tax=Asanoa siamensis TaxID=926357 RepID=A0ABQ4CLF5_9ACTN|nr:hypothetical protein Asi02nite_16210 [Asanoa siamensis]